MRVYCCIFERALSLSPVTAFNLHKNKLCRADLVYPSKRKRLICAIVTLHHDSEQTISSILSKINHNFNNTSNISEIRIHRFRAREKTPTRKFDYSISRNVNAFKLNMNFKYFSCGSRFVNHLQLHGHAKWWWNLKKKPHHFPSIGLACDAESG